MDKIQQTLRKIPSVDKCFRASPLQSYIVQLPRITVIDTIRKVQNEVRDAILSGMKSEFTDDSFYSQLSERLEKLRQGYLKRVVNATGIIIHTNLGRSIISNAVAENVLHLITGYNNLEYDIELGKRSSRYEHLVSPLRQLTGFEDSLIVNNNAAAVLLLLDTFAKGREVIVSRSELIEIGGGFRLPEVMKKAEVKLIEVGCTNKTYIQDYQEALTDDTAMIVKIHRSNYHISGFVAEPSVTAIASLAKKHDLLFMYDLGSGNLLPPEIAQNFSEPSIRDPDQDYFRTSLRNLLLSHP
ncbi:L-seryl-tRNA(Sec) selenium transferase, partial [candidate division CSSED10-310 bacterium]